jgi:outer membrane biosynthesis protein TonB
MSAAFSRRSFLLLAGTLAVAGCETLDKLNPFEERKAPLPGDRKPLFPQGVPGVNYGEPPPQPANAPPPAAAEQPPEAQTEPAKPKAKSKPKAKARPQQEQAPQD